jgi:hypothetical protein
VRFEADGTGSRELTGRVRVQSEAATHDLGLLRFSYASTFESLTIGYVRVRKPDGTMLVTPASDVQEVDLEVSRQAPMYTDQREKHVAVKALGSGDVLEYHMVWTTHDALAPGHFWIAANFLRNGICLDEQIEVGLPQAVPVKFFSGGNAPTIREEGPCGRRKRMGEGKGRGKRDTAGCADDLVFIAGRTWEMVWRSGCATGTSDAADSGEGRRTHTRQN